MISLEIDSRTEYATAYDGDKPVATLQRRRVYEQGPAWKVFANDGALLFNQWSGTTQEALAKRIEDTLSGKRKN